MNIAANRRNIVNFLKSSPTYKASCVFKWLGHVSTLDGVSHRIRHYIDQATKPESQTRNPNKGEMPKAAIDYIPHKRNAYVRGFLIEEVQRKTGLSPHLLEPVSMLQETDIIWRDRIKKLRRRKSDATMHNIVISLSPEMCELLKNSGKDVDAYLLDISAKSMRHMEGYLFKHYNKVAKKNNTPAVTREQVKIGYIVGIHHDRQHIHAHLSMFPYTSGGHFIKKATDRKRGYDAFNDISNFARKYALDKFKKELLAPALMVETGENLIWQKNLVMAKNFHEATSTAKTLTDAGIAEELFARQGQMASADPKVFSENVSAAYQWAEERYKTYKRSRITLDEVEAGKDSMRMMGDESVSLAKALTRQKSEISRIDGTRDIIAKQLADMADNDDYPQRYPKREPCKEDDALDVIYRKAFTTEDEDSPQVMKILNAIFENLVSVNKKFSVYKMFQGVLEDLFGITDKKGKKALRAYKCPEPEEPATPQEREKGKNLLAEKLKQKDEELSQRKEAMVAEYDANMARLRFLSHQQTAAMLDIYFKENILNNKTPMLFSPAVKDVVSTQSVMEDMSDVREVLKRVRETSQSLRKTPEIVSGKATKTLRLTDEDNEILATMDPFTMAKEKLKQLDAEVAGVGMGL